MSQNSEYPMTVGWSSNWEAVEAVLTVPIRAGRIYPQYTNQFDRVYYLPGARIRVTHSWFYDGYYAQRLGFLSQGTPAFRIELDEFEVIFKEEI